MTDVAAWFRSVDVDGTGSINPQELGNALAQGGWQFKPDTLKEMIRMYDRDGNGTMNFDEFQTLHGFIMQMIASFRSFDKDNSGTITAQELYPVLQAAGYQLDQPSFGNLMRRFDDNRSGNVSLDEYIDICIFLGKARNLFAWFDQARQGRITIDFNQFIYLGSLL